MAAPRKTGIQSIALSDIDIPDRLRELDEKKVELIVKSAQDGQGIRDAIHVRSVGKGKFSLIDGRHRLDAAYLLGLREIDAEVWTCSAKQARFMEADANLSSGLLTPLDMAVSLAARKAAYEELYPETKRGVAGALARHGEQRTEMSFADYMAAVTGQTSRQIRRVVSAGEALAREEVRALQSVAKLVKMNDLYELAKIGDDAERSFVVEKIATGEAKQAGKARKLYAAETGQAPAPVDPTEAEFQALLKAWGRARKAARLRFLEEVTDELTRMQEDGDV